MSEVQDSKELFSKAALDKLRSPEKLDMLLPITTPLGWMGLVAVMLLLCSVVLWSVFGSFTVRADGMGLIMDSGGLANITHVSGGKITQFYVRGGSTVKKGDVVARLDQTNQSADSALAQYGTQLGENLKDTAKLAYQYKSKMYQKALSQDVVSEYDGVIEQVLVREGSVVAGGTPLASVRLTKQRSDFKGVLYVPVDKGKRVAVGQTIQLVPGGVDVQESGSLIGIVRTVSEYPVPMQSLETTLGNAAMAQFIMSQEGAVMEVTFDLVKDDNSESGFLWTSFVGEHKPVTAGSFVTGSIIIERRPPIEKVFYKISQWLRNR